MTVKASNGNGFPWIDRRDFVGIIGVSLVGVGCWWISPPLGLIVPGTILCGVAIFGVKS